MRSSVGRVLRLAGRSSPSVHSPSQTPTKVTYVLSLIQAEPSCDKFQMDITGEIPPQKCKTCLKTRTEHPPPKTNKVIITKGSELIMKEEPVKSSVPEPKPVAHQEPVAKTEKPVA